MIPFDQGATTAQPSVPGFDRAQFEAWLSSAVDVAPPLAWKPLTGGHSNLTYLISDASNRGWVVRRPPLGELLPRAHDMQREHRILSALWPTAVPVAEPIAYCDDRRVADTNFYLMAKVDGAALFNAAEVDGWMPERSRADAARSFIDALTALHALDPGAVGLADLGRPAGYVARQLRAWHRSWVESGGTAELEDGRMAELNDWLRERIPPQRETRVVHGDLGPHNAMFSPAGDVTAVIDWELTTLGDPLADFAYSLNAWVEPGEPGIFSDEPPTALAGFPDRRAIIDRYQTTTGRSVDELPYYRCFNYFKLAGILAGVYARYASGQKSAMGVDLAELRRRIERIVDLAWNARTHT